MSKVLENNNISNNEYEDLIAKSLNSEKSKEKCIVEGKVIAIENDVVIVDIGLKSEGRIPISEFGRSSQNLDVQIGDSIKVFIDKLDGLNGETKLSREKAVKQAAWNKLQDSFDNKTFVTGIPTNKVKGGMSVDLEGVTAFLPGSQIDPRQIADTKDLLNKPLDFLILKMDKYRGNIVVSRKAISDIELKEQRQKLLSNISEGSIIEGKIKNITDYGAFIDLGGIDGLVHVTDISWRKINHPSDVLNLGDKVKVKILKFDQEITRLSLGIKQLTDDPWEKVNELFKVDENYEGEVFATSDLGVSLSLKNEYDGFIQTNELSWLKKPPHPSKILQTNEKITIKLVEINDEKRKLYFSLKQLKENPWEKIKDTFKVGDVIETTIVNKVDFGVFVKVLDEIDGMVHISDLSWDELECSTLLNNYKKGDKVSVKILDIDTDKERISLGIKHLVLDPIQEFISKNPIKSIVSGKIKSIDEKGLSIELEKNISGYIKKTNLAKERLEQKIDRFAINEMIDSMIISYDDKLRKINLSIKEIEIDEEKKVLSKYGSSDSGASLGDILGDALNKKKSE
ncbi:MAG: 30S ribosomal protein S1 [Alphaproteobacteria bacterium MarineAlpha5_Bin8]|nr:MAG: 30S ribosomal protein S1 [Alphaproteobacteria bacterium MarineAlpha5_Bin7]PPR46351.1 MAG: 30S ribosomal protein S1 [Alphaproteobacteria bacterium MarineAlpha5_Bin8]PPR54987.1 MAG: 30S ribosomal protein S1 [Alphaproteobacteria bacterium MarineAlpha5_Bin6]|tara:strand:+ start:175 stop:1881 length:1707 start_codon:yes stop_codon:yes gene_type:complete